MKFWSFTITYWNVIAATAFILTIGWLAFMNTRKSRAGWKFTLLESLRLIIASLLIFTLFRPELVHRTKKSDQPMVAILCDASESMQTRDIINSDNRAIKRETWLSDKKESKFWLPLTERYKVVVEDFSAPAEGATDENGTDINAALEKLIDGYGNLRTVILLSDGDWNMGRSPSFASTRLCMNGIPVYPVITGSDEYLPDVELQNISAPAYGLMDEHISIPFSIQSRLKHDFKTTITLKSSSGIETTKNITIPAMSQLQESILFKPSQEGNHKFSLNIPVPDRDVFPDNNSRSFTMSLRREILNVLVIDTLPRWEYRFLRNALSRDPGVNVNCLLLHPGMKPGGGPDYISAFPSKKEDLSGYDVVFVGDIGIGPNELTEDQATLLRGLVEQQGSGLVFLPGRHGRQMSLLSSDLGDMIPVELDETNPKGHPFGIESGLSLTARGRDHLLTMLAGTPSRNHLIWKSLPGTYWHAPVIRAKLGTTVLAVHSNVRNEHGRLPLLVTNARGNGKVLFMGTDGAWRWRRGVEDTYHYRFWGQVVRWMAHQRHLAHVEGIRFFFSPENPVRGSKVFLHATVFDNSGFPLSEGSVTATITGTDGSAQKLELTPEAGGWGVFTGSFTPEKGGTYQILVRCEEADREVQTQINVSSPRRERIGRPARTTVLKEIANITRGRTGTTDDLEDIVKSINLLPEAKPVERRFRLWCHPLWAGLIVVLLAVYWSGRKLLGML